MTGLQVADRWFVRERHADGVTRLYEPHVSPLIRCNIFHVAGRDRDLIVDTGVGVASVRDELSDLIDKPVTAVATHIHYDHVGGLHEFDDTVMHRIEAPRMASYSEFGGVTRQAFDIETLEYLSSIGYPIEEPYLIDALPHAGYDPTAYEVQSVEVTRQVDDGDRIDLGDRSFEVLHLPGHSPGNIGLWEASSETLFTGDALYDGPLIDTLPDSDIDDYRETMATLLGQPARVVHGGHDASFGRDRMIELIEAYLADRG